jgi:hypothetical protein
VKTLTYNSAHLSAKERLTISSLLSLFGSRLNAKWVAVNEGQGAVPDVVLVDGDQTKGREALAASSSRQTILPVTENDRWPHSPFVARPIRAYGPNGVVVLLNSLGQSLPAAGKEKSDQRQEPSRFRMTGGLEASPAPVRTIRPPAPVPTPTATPAPKPVSQSAPPSERPQVRVDAPTPARAVVRWGPPQPVILPPLMHMPGAHIHLFGQAAQRQPLDLPPSSPLPDATPAVKPMAESELARSWRAPEPLTDSPLISMPVAHRPIEVHRPPAPVIGRARIEEPAPPPKPAVRDEAETPILRTSPPQWRAPEPELVSELMDFQSLFRETPSESPVSAAPAALEPEQVSTEPTALDKTGGPALEMAPQSATSGFMEALDNLSNAVAAGSVADELDDLGLDWWAQAQLELASAAPASTQLDERSMLSALKAIKGSNQPSILEIGGLPAVCVIPARNVYFTSAPAARLETAIRAQAEVAWRPCASETEARQLSGTEQSRQASLEQLYWTASLLTGAPDVERIADRAVRLRRWPPLTESRGRSKFVRYATLLSGAQATPREIAEITGDGLEEIAAFVQACAEMNLLETGGQAAAPVATPAARGQGAGILRSMIEQLTPPRL